MLIGEEGAGAAVAGLHFVQHQQPLVGVANAPQRLQVALVRNVDAALALNGLHEHGHRIGVVGGDSLYGRHVVERRPGEAGQQRLEPGLHLALPSGGQGGHGAPVKAGLRDQHVGLCDA